MLGLIVPRVAAIHKDDLKVSSDVNHFANDLLSALKKEKQAEKPMEGSKRGSHAKSELNGLKGFLARTHKEMTKSQMTGP